MQTLAAQQKLEGAELPPHAILNPPRIGQLAVDLDKLL